MPSFRPVFVGGAGRSGTTLVADLVGTHPDLSPVYETDLVVQVAAELFSGRPVDPARIRAAVDAWTEPLPLRPHNKRSHERYVHGPHHVLFERAFALDRTDAMLARLKREPVSAFRDWVEALFAAHAAADGKPRWVNKTPVYVRMLPLLKTIWPDLLFLHCVRDGRDATASVLTRPWGPSTWTQAGPWWRANVEPALAFADQHPAAVHVVRYEDLLTDPVPALAAILGPLGLDGAEDTVDRYVAAGGALDPGRTGAWRSADPAGLAAFECSAGDLLAALGYPRSSALAAASAVS